MITLPNFRYMWADMLAAGGHPAGGDIKAMINIDEYGLLNKVSAIAGVALTFGRVYSQLQNVDLAAQAGRLDVPVFFAKGRHDANAMPILVERYCELLQAPHKELVWFKRSAHNPCFEEADRFNSFMIDTVLARAHDHSRQGVPA